MILHRSCREQGGKWKQSEFALVDGTLVIDSQSYVLDGAQLCIFRAEESLPPSPLPFWLKIKPCESMTDVEICFGSELELRQWVLRLMPLVLGSEDATMPITSSLTDNPQQHPSKPFKMNWVQTLEVCCAGALLNVLLVMILFSSPYNFESWLFVLATNAFVGFAVLIRMEQLILLRNISVGTIAINSNEAEELDDMEETSPSFMLRASSKINKLRKLFALQTTLQQSEMGIASPHSYTSFAENLLTCIGCDLYLTMQPQGGWGTCEQMIFRDEVFDDKCKSLIVFQVQVQHTSSRLLFSKSNDHHAWAPGYSLICYYLPADDGQTASRLFASREALGLKVGFSLAANNAEEVTSPTLSQQCVMRVYREAINKFEVKTVAGRSIEVLEFTANFRNLDLLSKLTVNSVLDTPQMFATHHLCITFSIFNRDDDGQDDLPTASLRLNRLDLGTVTLW